MNLLNPLLPYLPYLLLLLTIMGIVDFAWCWIQRYRANRSADKFFSLLERSVEADEKHNEIGEKLTEEARRLQTTIKPRKADEPLPEEPRFLTTIN